MRKKFAALFNILCLSVGFVEQNLHRYWRGGFEDLHDYDRHGKGFPEADIKPTKRNRVFEGDKSVTWSTSTFGVLLLVTLLDFTDFTNVSFHHFGSRSGWLGTTSLLLRDRVSWAVCLLLNFVLAFLTVAWSCFPQKWILRPDDPTWNIAPISTSDNSRHGYRGERWLRGIAAIEHCYINCNGGKWDGTKMSEAAAAPSTSTRDVRSMWKEALTEFVGMKWKADDIIREMESCTKRKVVVAWSTAWKD